MERNHALILIGILLAPVLGLAQRIEAENYKTSFGVQTETTTDVGGGKNVGYIDKGDSLVYVTPKVVAGNYTLEFRVASTAASSFTLIVNGVKSVVSFPSTGGYQTWVTISTQVSLSLGQNEIKINSLTPSWNINWLQLTYKPPVLIEVEDSVLTVNLFSRKLVIVFADGTKSDSIALPARPLRPQK